MRDSSGGRPRARERAAIARIDKTGVGALVALLAFTLVVYGNSLGNGFVWDDEIVVVQNSAGLGLSDALDLMFMPDMIKPYYRPINRLSYVIDSQVFGDRAAGFHAVNVAVHALSVLLVYVLGVRLVRNATPAFLAAALFAVHPVNTEAVNFISARNNLLALFFVLVSILAFLRGLEVRSWYLLTASGFLWCLGLLSKEPAAPALVVLAAIALVSPDSKEKTSVRRLYALLPHLGFAAIFMVLRTIALDGSLGTFDFGADLLQRVGSNVQAIPRYLDLALFPIHMNAMHGPSGPLAESLPWLLPVWAAIIVAIVLLVRTRSVPVLFGLLWIAVNYLPIANIVPIPTNTPIADRYVYIPALGLWIIAADRGYLLYERLGRSRALAAGALALIVVLGVVTADRNRDWNNEVSLFSSAVEGYPDFYRSHFNLGNALRDRGDMEGAQREWLEAVRLDPTRSGPMTQLGTLAAVNGNLQEAERWFRSALRVDPTFDTARYNLGLALEKTGRLHEAIAEYDLLLRTTGAENEDRIIEVEQRKARLQARLRRR